MRVADLFVMDRYENPERGTLTAEQWAGLFSFVENGGGLFALHTASACWMHSCNQTVRLLLLNAFARTSRGSEGSSGELCGAGVPDDPH